MHEIARQLAGYRIHFLRPTGSKENRAEPLQSQFEAGNVLLLRRDWHAEFRREVAKSPNGANDDQVDAASGMFIALTQGQQLRVTRNHWLH